MCLYGIRTALITLYAALAVSSCWLTKSQHSYIPSLSTQSLQIRSPTTHTSLAPGLAACTRLVSLRAHSQSQYWQPKHSYEGHWLFACLPLLAKLANISLRLS